MPSNIFFCEVPQFLPETFFDVVNVEQKED
jgi:hypothetical protein